MVHAGCVFVAGIHLSRTWMSGSFESVRWNARVHWSDLGLFSHPSEFLGGRCGEGGGGGMDWVRTHVNSKGKKIPSTVKILPWGGSNRQHCIKQDSQPNMLPMSNSGPDPQHCIKQDSEPNMLPMSYSSPDPQHCIKQDSKPNMLPMSYWGPIQSL